MISSSSSQPIYYGLLVEKIRFVRTFCYFFKIFLILILRETSQLLLGLLYLVVLVRYRALIPLMYLTLLLEYLGRMALGSWKPLVTLETPPGATLNLVMIVLSVVMLAISLREPAKRTETN